MELILDFIEDEHDFSGLPFQRDAWKQVAHKNSPLQPDGFSCGIYAILNGECLALGKPFNHSQEDVPVVRKKLQVLLISEGLEDPYVYDIDHT